MMATSTSKKRIHAQKYSDRYAQEFDFIKVSRLGQAFALCTACNADISINHGGRSDILSHAKTKKHIKNYDASKSAPKLNFSTIPDDLQTISAELLFTNFLLEHNIPLAAADHASSLFRAMFPESAEVKKFACGRTKAGHLVREIASDSTQKIANIIRDEAFTLATDGSNDTDNHMYPVVVTFFDQCVGQVASKLLSLPCLEGESTGENIANLMIEELKKLNIPFENCVSLSCDNAPVMTGNRKGLYAFLKIQQPKLFLMGCLCHLINLAAEKGAAKLPISFDELLIDVFYYFKKSFKRKNELKKFQNLCSVEEKKIIKHCITRWLSLGKCLKRIIDQWQALLLYFKEECLHPAPVTVKKRKISELNKATSQQKTGSYKIKKFRSSSGELKHNKNSPVVTKKKELPQLASSSKSVQPKEKMHTIKVKKNVLKREERIFMILSNDLYYALACFLSNSITVFEKYNTVFQSEIPRIHRLKCDLESFFTELLNKFVKADIIKASDSVFNVQYDNSANHKSNAEITIGSQTADILKKLSSSDAEDFFDYVKKYFITSCNYIISNFPIKSELLNHAQVADIAKKESVSFSSLKYFVDKYPCFLKKDASENVFEAVDKLEAEFLFYQTAVIPENILNKERIDEQWVALSKETGSFNQLLYSRLGKAMLGILTFPHSNATCERIFSLVRRNKTDFRCSMSISTLQSILIAKSQISVCYSQKYEKDFLKKAKSATTLALNK